jgi:hypothetical protein
MVRMRLRDLAGDGACQARPSFNDGQAMMVAITKMKIMRMKIMKMKIMKMITMKMVTMKMIA